MHETQPCPHCGAPIRIEPPLEEGVDLPIVPLLAPGSHDDSFLFSAPGRTIKPTEPESVLGEFPSSPPSSKGSSSRAVEGPESEGPSESFPAIDFGSTSGLMPSLVPSSFEPKATVEHGPGGRSNSGSSTPSKGSTSSQVEKPSASFPALDFGSPGRSSIAKAASVLEPGGSEEDEPQGRSTPWSVVLLASYASAVTLGLGWTLMKGRGGERTRPPAAEAASRPVESAREAGLSRKVEPPEPILGEYQAKVGRPLVVGSLEITPVEVKRQDVTLRRSSSFGPPEQKRGGVGAMVLRLKLKNRSMDAAFAPLDRAYLRERGKEIVDTFVETASDERIYPYPLALDSEWSIAGQGFEELRPGESRVVAIVTAPDAPPDSEGPFNWRVRLRTGLARTDVIGVRWPDSGSARTKGGR